MTPARWKKIESLFEAALEYEAVDRDAFLDRACDGDPSLRKEVEELLAHQQPTGRVISTLVHDAAKLLLAREPHSGPEARFIPGTVLGNRYRIIGLLGKGGMGEVYRADDLKLAQNVALKFLPENLNKDRAMLDRFHRGVRTARQITHPNVCRVYDIGEAEGQHFLSLEYVDGEDLASLLRRIGRLPTDKAVEIARHLCAGLAAAHQQGVLHRDLKPANIMVDGRGKARIMDFGLAGLAEEFQGGEVLAGTPAYMAPEQLSGREVTYSSDIYSLGLVLYEIFTGRKAFAASTLEELIRLRESTLPRGISEYVKEVDPLVERVILRCLEREPRNRPSTVSQLAAALPGGDPLAAAIAAGETPSPEMVAAAPKQGSLRPAVAFTLLASLLAALLFIVLSADTVLLHRLVPLEKPPEALADRATEITRRLGYSDPPADTAYGFDADSTYLRYIDNLYTSSSQLNRLAADRPSAIFFWYRQSPRYMVPKEAQRVSASDPPPLLPGMIDVVLDTRGRLTAFKAISSPPGAEPTPSAPRWQALFEEAGLEITSFKEATPSYPFLFNNDTRVAWEGVSPDQPDSPLRIEAAGFRGKPVYFEVLGPWSQPARLPGNEITARRRALYLLFYVLFMLILLSGALLAQRNLRLGRGDRKGALKLALFVLSVDLMIWLISASHVPTLEGEIALFSEAAAWGLLKGGLLWLFYIALEPYVRRRWPEKIISWSRLLAGGFRDPLVGRDFLIGMLAGVSIMGTSHMSDLLERWLGWPPDLYVVRLETLLGVSAAATVFLRTIFGSILMGMACLFLFLLISRVLRTNWLAMAALAGLITLSLGLAFAGTPITLLHKMISAALAVFILTRFGLLAVICLQYFLLMAEFYPYAVDLSVWYAGSFLAPLIIAAGLGVYSFYTSLAGQPLFRRGLLED